MGKIKFIHADDMPLVNSAEYARNAGEDVDDTGAAFAQGRASTDVRVFLPGSADSPQLFEACFGPNVRIPQHAHDEDEIFYILEGEIHVGRRVYPAGSVIFIPKYSLYGFTTGPNGMRFLNYRPKSAGGLRTGTLTKSELMDYRKSRASSTTGRESA